jgi:hypothetical protein
MAIAISTPPRVARAASTHDASREFLESAARAALRDSAYEPVRRVGRDVQLGLTAPSDVSIHRTEVQQKIVRAARPDIAASAAERRNADSA